MKKLITLSIIFVLTSIVLISCKSSSVMKRRYNKGYYVHHNSGHGDAKPAKQQSTNLVMKSPVVTEKLAEAQQAKTRSESSSAITAAVEQPAVAANHPANRAVKESAPASSNKLTKGSVKVLPTAFSHKKQLQLIKDLKQKALSGDSADDALSLLWILILVLLIIYLLGFAFDDYGVGAAIHLLALIIVILLILWLLRIL